MSLSRSEAARIARETVDTLHAGRYTTPGGQVVDIADALRAAVEGTVAYPPDAPLPKVVPAGRETRFEVGNETTLAAARRLHGAGHWVVALNFASARHPGGGFRSGARAQEESLCRAGGLYACLNNHDMYRHHAPLPGGIYTNYAIYSPDVPVFRDDAGGLLDEPYPVSFITAPAVNAGAVRADERDSVAGEMRERVEKVLAIAAGHGHDAVVLGAWGCGVFKNDPEVVAGLFREALVTRFTGVFGVVAFAVLDSSADRYFLGPFAARFGGVT
ncbi:MAG: TIGR02452 family protein [Gemmataceae bacterium]|nr:TIGR02452 family protein [Gemmataceae bacterium]